ncbi:phosphohistidine phosphatase, SixA [Modicisalibacter ilicicola DSM 19980]|uniref:Phosphohistidine phosphatase, SixA n=1 Tax=Modicisalibacter ilicicola DSM 19980 TaxID=1121942 RepID=A0A1M5BJ44_9GAMM|nr:phosphohistidine phosphatase SixA [Halomonas ilicicola]SHF42485.1 phosphohistidine phosphatase, SixA [Halomonas ilicicola DSM 19980]
MTATLWIMRHGQAGQGHPDPRRELTGHGRAEVARMAEWLAESLDAAQRSRLHIVASPYTRAQQTAEIVAERLGGEVATLSLITPDDPVEPVIDWLQDGAHETPQLLVSHMPLVGALSARLIEGDPRSSLPMPTAAIAVLQAEVWAPGCARLSAFRHPADIV